MLFFLIPIKCVGAANSVPSDPDHDITTTASLRKAKHRTFKETCYSPCLTGSSKKSLAVMLNKINASFNRENSVVSIHSSCFFFFKLMANCDGFCSLHYASPSVKDVYKQTDYSACKPLHRLQCVSCVGKSNKNSIEPSAASLYLYLIILYAVGFERLFEVVMVLQAASFSQENKRTRGSSDAGMFVAVRSSHSFCRLCGTE